MSPSSIERLKDENTRLRNERNYYQTENRAQKAEIKRLHRLAKESKAEEYAKLLKKFQLTSTQLDFAYKHIDSIERSHTRLSFQLDWCLAWFHKHERWLPQHNQELAKDPEYLALITKGIRPE